MQAGAEPLDFGKGRWSSIALMMRVSSAESDYLESAQASSRTMYQDPRSVLNSSQQSVSSQTEAVETRCGDIVRCIDANNGITNISSGDVTDVWDKFKLWAGNIGARQTPNSAASLESRLKGAKRVLEQVVRLLNDIQEALDDLFEIASGNQENRSIPPAPELISDDPTSVQLSNWNDLGNSKLERYEDQDLLELISKSIGSLLKITVLIRKATPRDRFAKALQGSNPFMDDFDIAYVAERYPKLAGPDARWLCERLGRAITKRRQFLRYSREHSRRIAGHGDIDPVDHRMPQHSIEQDGALFKERARSSTPSIASGMRTNYSGSYAAYTHTSTKASTLDIAQLRHVEDIQADDGDTKSYVSAGSSFQLDKADSSLHLPTLEEKFATASSSVMVNLGLTMSCNVIASNGRVFCANKVPSGARGPGDDQLAVFVNAGLRAVDAIPAKDCPFCDEWADSMHSTIPQLDLTTLDDVVTVEPKQYRRHVSQHLEQLALFALPRHRDGDLNDNTSEGANVSRSTINQLEPTSSGDEFESIGEWVPDPPLHIAAARGDYEEAWRLIDDGADIHLRGETWGSALDAALAYRGIRDSRLLVLFRRELEDYQVHDEGPSSGQLTTPMAPSQSDAPELPGPKKLRCPYCTNSFTRRHNLKSHLLTHEQERPYLCRTCQLRFRSLYGLESHSKLHTVEKPHACPKCNLKFSRADALEHHSQIAHGSVGDRESLGTEMLDPTTNSEANTSTFDKASNSTELLSVSDIDTDEYPSKELADIALPHKVLRAGSSQPKSPPENDERQALARDVFVDTSRPSYEAPSKPRFSSPRSIDDSRIGTSTLEESFEYTKLSDFVKYDLSHDGARLSGRRSSFDEGYQRPPFPVVDGVPRMNSRRRPPPPSSGLERYNRAAAAGLFDTSSTAKHIVLQVPAAQHDPQQSSVAAEGVSTLRSSVNNRGTAASNNAPSGIAQLRKRSEHLLLHQPKPMDLDDLKFKDNVPVPEGLVDTLSPDISAKHSMTNEHPKEKPRFVDPQSNQGTQDPTEDGNNPRQRQVVARGPPPLKGILKKPTSDFPDHPGFTREGVSTLECPETKPVPPGARWTKISRKLVNSEALAIGKERFEVRDDFVIVLRVVSKEEIQAYASATAQLRARRRKDIEEGRENSRLTERVTSQLGGPARSRSPPLPAVEESTLGWSTSTRGVDRTALKPRTRQEEREAEDTNDP
ncbi:hypothetical protein PG997_002184 [Apiospora hydei]|uniref:C2H2-type domain-containing protein n=1 Tax=Apiospora hydei TaxID=1337664 RepID=A0ABR1X8S9_9PEZI